MTPHDSLTRAERAAKDAQHNLLRAIRLSAYARTPETVEAAAEEMARWRIARRRAEDDAMEAAEAIRAAEMNGKRARLAVVANGDAA